MAIRVSPLNKRRWQLFRQNNAGFNLGATLAVWALIAVWATWGLPLLHR